MLTDIVRGYWNKADGSDIEIDLVACNNEDKIVRFGSCKRAAASHDGKELRKFDGHIDRFLRTKEGRRFAGWTVEKALYSPKFAKEQKSALVNKNYKCLDLTDFHHVLFGQK